MNYTIRTPRLDFAKINFVAKQAFLRLQHHDWAVAGKTLSSMRLVLKVLREVNPNLEGKLNTPIGSIGMLSLFNVISFPVNFFNGCRDLVESAKIGDFEGIALAVPGIGMIVGNGIDSFMAVNYSLKELWSDFPIAPVVQKFFLPLAIAMTVSGIFLRTIAIFQEKELINEIEKFQAEKVPSLAILKKRMTGITSKSELLEKMNRKHIVTKEEKWVLRRSSLQVLEFFKSFKEKDFQKLDQIKKFLRRKIAVGVVSQLVNLITLVVFGVMFCSIIAPYVSLGILSALSLLKIGIYVYETQTIYEGLPVLYTNNL